MLEKNKKIKQLLDDVVNSSSNKGNILEKMNLQIILPNGLAFSFHINKDFYGVDSKESTELQKLLITNYDDIEVLELIKNHPNFDDDILCVCFSAHQCLLDNFNNIYRRTALVTKETVDVHQLIKTFYSVLIQDKISIKTIEMFFENFRGIQECTAKELFEYQELSIETIYGIIQKNEYDPVYVSALALARKKDIPDDVVCKLINNSYDDVVSKTKLDQIMLKLINLKNISSEDLDLILSKTSNYFLICSIKAHPNFKSKLSTFIDEFSDNFKSFLYGTKVGAIFHGVLVSVLILSVYEDYQLMKNEIKKVNNYCITTNSKIDICKLYIDREEYKQEKLKELEGLLNK